MLMVFSMRATPFRMESLYRHGARLRFSKTARPRPGHHEAGRHRLRMSLLPEAGRRLANDLVKGAAEGAEAAEADVEADIGDATVGQSQQEHRALDAPALQVAVRRLAEGVAERGNEVSL